MATFPPLKNDLFLRVARGQPAERVPVWIMRQAGRYLSEFRALREKHNFFEMCQTPALAAEVTLQPIMKFPLDAAIIFSDILVIPQAMGLEVTMEPGVGPVLPHPLKTPEDMSRLTYDGSLEYVYDAIKLTREKLEGRVPLIGFAGAPWTLMSYMIEGGGSKTWSKPKRWLYAHPEESKLLLDKITELTIQYLVNQVRAGAQALQVFESHADFLNRDLFLKYSLPYLARISHEVKKQLGDDAVPMIVFPKGAHYALKELGKLNYDVVGIDWTVDPAVAREQIGPNVTLQGNLDPCALYAPQDKLRDLAQGMVAKFGKQRYIANLGHGIYPDTNPENVRAFIQAVQSA
ncbi:unnamed protein product [Darwinula stevensoni]|uniref:Uroporphyrinogen decarboxylase n=1 Tax=Darwinula stevensoni TaxID=69355 RepID=A0A7R9A4X1_9CRUS|nr:unnamed protein product [Darwinula stevensoni]CAG0885195.1 unnamed protein product [Darwinula stevensoni]